MMSIPYVYIDKSLPDVAGSFIELDADESFHLCKVLRLRKGNQVLLTDGKGYVVECEIVEADIKETALQMSGRLVFYPKKNYSVHIAIAPTKHPDRLEWFIEKATETGIDNISLIICEHSEKWNVKLPRLRRLMISAMKQSQQCRLPEFRGPVSLKEMINQCTEQEKWIGYCEGNPEFLAHRAKPGNSVVVAIGPEGDFSASEVETAIAKGFNPISLGPTRLRTETAGLVASLMIHTINGLKI